MLDTAIRRSLLLMFSPLLRLLCRCRYAITLYAIAAAAFFDFVTYAMPFTLLME